MYIAPARHWHRCPRSDWADGARSLCRGSCAVFDAAMSEALPERRGLRASVVHAPVPPPEAPGGGDSHRRAPGARWRAREEWADFDACRPARAGRFVHPSLVSSLHPSPSSSPSGLLLASLPFVSLRVSQPPSAGPPLTRLSPRSSLPSFRVRCHVAHFLRRDLAACTSLPNVDVCLSQRSLPPSTLPP